MATRPSIDSLRSTIGFHTISVTARDTTITPDRTASAAAFCAITDQRVIGIDITMSMVPARSSRAVAATPVTMVNAMTMIGAIRENSWADRNPAPVRKVSGSMPNIAMSSGGNSLRKSTIASESRRTG